VTVASGVPSTLAIPAASEASNSFWLSNNCRLLVDIPYVLQPVVLTDANGDAASPLPIPTSSGLIGYSLFYQWGGFEPGGGPLFGDFSLSGGLQLQLGQ
jgi:hypothetical protein